MATRCIWPPESSDMRWSQWSIRQRDGLQRVHGAHFALATGHIGVGQRQHDVFDNRQARQQVEALKDKANAQGANFG